MYCHKVQEQAKERAAMVFYMVCTLVVVLVILATVIAVSVAKVIMQGVTRPVDELKYAAAEMAQGRLRTEIAYESKDELGQLADSIREMQTTLVEYVEEISDTLEMIAGRDLTMEFSDITEFCGEFHMIKTSFVHSLKEFNNALAGIVFQVEPGSSLRTVFLRALWYNKTGIRILIPHRMIICCKCMKAAIYESAH